MGLSMFWLTNYGRIRDKDHGQPQGVCHVLGEVLVFVTFSLYPYFVMLLGFWKSNKHFGKKIKNVSCN